MGNPSEEDGLHAAARCGDLRALESMYTNNPLAVNSRDKHSRTPLHLAAWSGHTDVVSYLCKNKADVAAAAMDDMGAIHFAAQKGHLEVVRTLLSSGASIKASNRKGFTPLHFAAQGSHAELVKYLVRKGANLTAKTKAGKTPLHLATNQQIHSLLDSSKQVEQPIVQENNHEDKDETFTGNLEKEDPKGEKLKRKDEEADIEGSMPKPKKPKIALNHLLSSDDTQEEDNQ